MYSCSRNYMTFPRQDSFYQTTNYDNEGNISLTLSLLTGHSCDMDIKKEYLNLIKKQCVTDEPSIYIRDYSTKLSAKYDWLSRR